MIHANDLRIGNYILNADGQYVKVEKIESAYFHEWNGSDDEPIIFSSKGRMRSSEVINPIPLTEEILLKCGFRDNDYYFNNNILFFYRRIDGKYVPQISDQLLDEIKHLHQLQNLYFALTGKELEIKWS